MLKKTITFVNPFTDQTVTEEHYFHISKADLVEMEMEEHTAEYTKSDGEKLTGMQAKIQKIVDSEDGKAIMTELKDIIRRSYGRKEGDRFLKSKDISDDFMSSEAFSQLFFDLCTNAEDAAAFMNGIIPNNIEQIADEVRKQAEQADRPTDPTGLSEPTPPSPREKEIQEATPDKPVTLNRDELLRMDDGPLRLGLGDGRYKLA